jgi:3-oxoacyl-[acyl-carrier protein] reductase
VSAAVVTGAAGAIGRAIAAELGGAGLAVVCVDRSQAVEETAAELEAAGVAALPCVVDLTAERAPAQIADAAARLGGARVLVNNAGITRDGRARKLAEEDFRAVVRVNAVAPMRLAEAMAARIEDGGCIVNIASRAALGNFGQANYVAAKSALIGHTRATAMRWAPRLRVNAVAPGLVSTPMTEAMPARVLEKLTARIPMGRMGTAEEIAATVAFLASERASYVTGQVLFACGGRSVAG